MTLSTVPGRDGSSGVHIRDDRPGPVSPALARSYAGYAGRPGDTRSDLLQRLTGRQRQVLALIAQGRSNAAIARLLSISERAVVGHISNIYEQLDLPLSDDQHRRVRAVLCYIAS